MVEHDSVGHSAAMTAPRVGRAELGTVRLDQGSELDPQRLDQGCWQQRHGLSRRSSGLQQSHDHLQVCASTFNDTLPPSCAGRSYTVPMPATGGCSWPIVPASAPLVGMTVLPHPHGGTVHMAAWRAESATLLTHHRPSMTWIPA